MGVAIEINDEGFTAGLERLAAAGKNIAPLLMDIAQIGVSHIQLCFKQSRDPYGSPWAELKSREGQPLRKSGRLNRAITGRATADGVAWGTNVRYAATHQFGAEIEAHEAYAINKTVAKGKKVFPIKLANGTVIFRKSFRRRHTLAFKIGRRWVYAMKVNIPARPYLPNAEQGLPEPWSRDIGAAIESHVGGGDA